MRRHALATAFVGLVLLAAAVPATASTNDPYFADQWGLAKVRAEQAWQTTTGTGALVAVLDSGVDLTHPDLDGNLVTYQDADFVEPDGTCTGNAKRGRVCVQDGAQDANGHGTHVAGIVAAEANNGTGVAGVAPGAKVLPVRVLDAEGSGTAEQLAAGVRYAADKGADVINLSLGWLTGQGEVLNIIGGLDPVYAAFDYARARGVVIVVAAGNDSGPLCAEPAAAPNVVCVGATDPDDLRSYYSNGDATMTKNFLVAPGGRGGLFCEEDILSTYLRGAETFCGPANGYEAIAGTSMATPFVSGVAGLLASKGLTSTQIVACLLSSADDLGVPGHDPVFGAGRLNAAAAVTSC